MRLAIPFDPAPLLAGVWALGSVAVLAFWLMRWTKVRAALREATPLALPAPIPVLASAGMLEPGLVGIRRPVLVLPAALFDRLDRPAIDALVAHETCHLRRRDNLTAAIHMLVEALFWFHPMVWWIGGRLVQERERACDEAVVRAGHDRAVYAESLLACCRLFLQSPLRCVAGASGSNLSRRVEMIMTSRLRSPLSRSGKAVLIAAGICALASPVAAGWLTSPAERQAVSRAVALASSPASTLIGEPPAAAAPDRSEAADTITAARAGAAPAARVQQIAAFRPEPMRLESGAEDQLTPEFRKPLSPVTSAGIPDVRLIPVADTGTSEATAPLGPGHYVETSGMRALSCCEDWSPWFAVTTRPIAPGHTITDFHYDLKGGGTCWPKRNDKVTADCRVITDEPDKKVVRFRLHPDSGDCFGAAGPEPSFCNGAATHAQMVLSYDVQ